MKRKERGTRTRGGREEKAEEEDAALSGFEPRSPPSHKITGDTSSSQASAVGPPFPRYTPAQSSRGRENWSAGRHGNTIFRHSCQTHSPLVGRPTPIWRRRKRGVRCAGAPRGVSLCCRGTLSSAARGKIEQKSHFLQMSTFETSPPESRRWKSQVAKTSPLLLAR